MRRFRLSTEEGSPLYIEVRLYRSRRLMHAALCRQDRLMGVTCDWSETRAVSRAVHHERLVAGRWTERPLVAVVFLSIHDSYAGLVAHELTHAAIQWARRVHLSGRSVWWLRSPRGSHVDESVANERFVWMVGWLNAQFWAKRWRR